jgi:hypothetical protein
MSEKVGPKEMALAAALLDEASESYSNHGCNDWEFPADWTRAEKVAFVRAWHEWNGDPEEFDEKHLSLPDYAVMSFLADRLRTSTPTQGE